jgi:hypothetical protein
MRRFQKRQKRVAGDKMHAIQCGCKQSIHNLKYLKLFDKLCLLPSFDPEFVDKGGILLHILVKEHPYQLVSLKGEWSFLAKESSWPNLVQCPLTFSLLMT